MYLFYQEAVNWALLEALIGLFPILVFLIATKHATFETFKGTKGQIACVDKREDKAMWMLGGSASMTFGIFWLGIASLLPSGLIKDVLIGYFILQFVLSLVSILVLITGIISSPEKRVIQVKAHLDGCGFTSAWGPFFILYWIQKIPGFGFIVRIRDFLTWIDWYMSYLWVLLFGNLVSFIFTRRWLKPTIGHVDHQH